MQCGALQKLSQTTPLNIIIGQEKRSERQPWCFPREEGAALSYHSRRCNVQVECQQQRQRDDRADVLPEPAHSAPHMIRTHARQGEACSLVAPPPGAAYSQHGLPDDNTSEMYQARPTPVCLACTQGPACAGVGRESGEEGAHSRQLISASPFWCSVATVCMLIAVGVLCESRSTTRNMGSGGATAPARTRLSTSAMPAGRACRRVSRRACSIQGMV